MILIATTCLSKSWYLEWVGPLVLSCEEVRRVPASIPGVYVLHGYDEDQGAYRPLYVGKATDVRRRMAQHMRSRGGSVPPEVALLRRVVQLHFSAAPVLEAPALARLEAGLVLMLRPPFNRQVPAAQPLYPNLPPMVFERRTS